MTGTSDRLEIVVLMGGTSSERDVSLASGIRIVEALRSRGHAVTAVDPARGEISAAEQQALAAGGVVRVAPPSQESLRQMAREALPRLASNLPRRGDVDVVFLGLHGGSGEDGTIQAMLELTGVPYTGSNTLASALAMDKDLSKVLFRQAGVGTADWLMAPASADSVQSTLGYPVIVKPSKQGSTVGLSIVKEPGGLQAAVDEAFDFDDEVMIERFVPGRELTVGILGGEALPVGEIIPRHEIYDYECKYTAGMAEERFPAELTANETAQVQDQAQKAFAALKLRGYARIDFRMASDSSFYCLEANTLPGMTHTSLIPQAAAAAGITFPALCERIVHLALDAHARASGSPHVGARS
jgi:D-alanine-D-alanine ligase